MILTEELIYEKIGQNMYAIMVTVGNDQLTSRTMTYGFSPGKGLFFLTHKGSGKLAYLANNPNGLLHIFSQDGDISSAYDISIAGTFERCEESSAYYREGFEALGKKNPQVLSLLNSSAKADYELLLFHIGEIRGCSYEQAINGLPKTIIRG